MKDRLKELAAEAYKKLNPGEDPYGEADSVWFGFGDLEKLFANLIVKECVGIKFEELCAGIGKNEADIVRLVIEEHFGVE